MKVRVIELFTVVGGTRTRTVNSIKGALTLTAGKEYDVSVSFTINDDNGNTHSLQPKPYAAANKVDFYLVDFSPDNNANFVIVGGPHTNEPTKLATAPRGGGGGKASTPTVEVRQARSAHKLNSLKANLWF